MKNFAGSVLILLAIDASAAIRYVDVNSASPAPPYTSWLTAAITIQDAVDAAGPGDLVLVTNGVYQTGGRLSASFITNRVNITKPLTVQSVNGPGVTIIQGYPTSGMTNGFLRCVYLTNGAVLSGFTLTNGGARPGYGSGGVLGQSAAGTIVSNCVIVNNAGYNGAGASSCTLVDCVIASNLSSGTGGGISGSVASNCAIIGNVATGGGGSFNSTLRDCLVASNTITGGGIGYGGGGAYGGKLNRCTVIGNTAATFQGGGADHAELNNCLVIGNGVLGGSGGGLYASLATNCTIIGNFSRFNAGGGVSGAGSVLNNCIVYFNTGPSGVDNYTTNVTFNYSCTTPLPPYGNDNLTNDPQLASVSHLSALSPCRAAGNAAFTTGADIDGEPWANPPSIGCDEFHPGTVTGPLDVKILATSTATITRRTEGFTAQIEGKVTESRWDLGDGTQLTNTPIVAHAWTVPGDYLVALQVFNEDFPDGITQTTLVHVSEATIIVPWGLYISPPNQLGAPPDLVSNIVAIADGENHGMALKCNGRVAAWGANREGQTNVPLDLTNAVAIAAGSRQNLALGADGSITCWGSGQTNVPAHITNVTAIATRGFASYFYSGVVMNHGSVFLWDDTGASLPVPGHVTNAIAIELGYTFRVALQANGTVAAWGSPWHGLTVLPETTNVPPSAVNVTAISSGPDHSLALRSDGTVIAWGHNKRGQCDVPAGLTDVVAIAAGEGFSLALKKDRTVVIWGQLWNGATWTPPTLPPGLTNVSAISAGNYHFLSLVTDGYPLVTQPLVDRLAVYGVPSILSAEIRGAGPLTYQWFLNGVAIEGETNATLVHPGESGTYSVVAQNSFGAVTNSGKVTMVPFLITTHPKHKATSIGGTAVFNVAVKGGPVTFQWRRNGVDIPGANGASLVLPNVNPTMRAPIPCSSAAISGAPKARAPS